MTPISVGQEIDRYLSRLFPICRSLTGDGNRQTLSILKEIVPIELKEYPSLKEVYDWEIPPEWNISDAWIKDCHGNKLVDFRDNNLHVVGYSEPVRAVMKFGELAPRLHYLDAQPDAIPYRTSYYQRDWGFCVTKKQHELLKATQGELDVCIDASLDPNGAMTIGELIIPGRQKAEFLISTYICHPSMANDNLSGIMLTAFLAKALLEKGIPNYTWRFVFVPETIGAIAYLYHNEDVIREINGGLVVSCCGGAGEFGYKATFQNNHLVDRACHLAFKQYGIQPILYPFSPKGSDERQYSSPGFRIPVATITKDKYYEYPEYHTSLDNLDFVSGEQLARTLEIYQEVVNILDGNRVFHSLCHNGEPQLGRRGLYPTLGGGIDQGDSVTPNQEVINKQIDVMNWLLFLADGKNDLVSVSEHANCTFEESIATAEKLAKAGILQFSDR